MNGFIKRGLITLAVTGGFLALGAGVAYADDGTSGDDGVGSGTQGVLGITLPVTIGGNGISVLGDSSSSGSGSTGGGGGGGSSAPSGSTGGSNSLLGGTQGLVGSNAPVTVSGNAISVLGDSSSEGSSFEGASGSGDAGSASTSGKEGILGGSQVVGNVDAPVTVGGNAISVAGDSFSGQSGTAAGSAGSGSSAPSGSTGGDDSAAGGTQVLADAGAPIVVGGNAISVIGDSTVDGPAGEVGGETTTPEDPGTVGGVTTAAAGVQLLASTGSALAAPGLAFAMLLLAAGVTFLVRTRLARS